jgi:hypothetical protein
VTVTNDPPSQDVLGDRLVFRGEMNLDRLGKDNLRHLFVAAAGDMKPQSFCFTKRVGWVRPTSQSGRPLSPT